LNFFIYLLAAIFFIKESLNEFFFLFSTTEIDLDAKSAKTFKQKK